MYEALVITPVKDSISTTVETITSILKSKDKIYYIVYNDFSTEENTKTLQILSETNDFELVNLSEITKTPSPNYRLVLQLAQIKALELNLPLIIIESDVEVKPDTIKSLITKSKELLNCGMVAAITTNSDGKVNFPYLNFKSNKSEVINTKHSLSFCCTLLTTKLLQNFSFSELHTEKHWYDVTISRKSIQLKLNNFLLTTTSVLHKPHSSRPWKKLKYQNPIKYYYRKFIKGLDRI